MITVVEPPRTTAFTTLARMRRELGLASTDTSQDDRLRDLVEEVSADIVSFCQQPFLRQTVSETTQGYGRTVAMLSVTPVPAAGVTAVRFGDDDPLDPSEYHVSNPNAGFIYRSQRWTDTRPRSRFITVSHPNMPGDDSWQFDYTGGYVMPGDDVTVSGALTVVSATNAFVLTDSTTFPILVSGEYITVVGCSGVANNGRHKVLSRTVQQLVVAEALTDEVTSGVVQVLSRTLPADLEGMAVREIKARYLAQRRDPTITMERLGDWQASYGSPRSQMTPVADGGFTDAVARGLLRYQRQE